METHLSDLIAEVFFPLFLLGVVVVMSITNSSINLKPDNRLRVEVIG